MNLKKILNNNYTFFAVYMFLFGILALCVHREVIFNAYNYGRHWDWTFYPLSDFYHYYLYSFFYSIKDNLLGYFDIVSISLAEFTLKLLMYFTYKVLNSLGLTVFTMPIINKLTVFFIFPLCSSFGIWKLSKLILEKMYHTNKITFFLITVFSNLIYTFSLVVIFDLHGGALNRQISSVIFPWVFYYLYSYFKDQNEKVLDRNLILVALFFIGFDIANIFYMIILTLFVIFIKKSSIRIKIGHIILLGSIIALLNSYWLHSLFIGNNVNLKAIFQERKLAENLVPSAGYSSTYLESFFLLNTPQRIIMRVFQGNRFIYAPFFFLYLYIFFNLLSGKVEKGGKREAFFLAFGFILSMTLVTGFYDIGNMYFLTYRFEILGFARAAIRFIPNLAFFSVFFFLVTAKNNTVLYDRKKTSLIFLIPILIWIFFLLYYSNLISLVYSRTSPSTASVNIDIGALYQYDPTLYKSVREERLLYNILPAPSWFSPFFVNNVFPPTSQGSLTDNIFWGKGIFYTNGVSLFTSDFFDHFVKELTPSFYSLANVKKIIHDPILVGSDRAEHNFTPQTVISSIPGESENIVNAFAQNKPYTVSNDIFYPIIYSPKETYFEELPLRYLSQIIKERNPQQPFAIILKNQNQDSSGMNDVTSMRSTNKPTIEFKKLSPTKYRVLAHGATDLFPLIFSHKYYPGWQLLLVNSSSSQKKENSEMLSDILANNYSPFQNNEDTQATSKELSDYINRGWISTVGDLHEKVYQHKEYEASYEINTYRKKFVIDYISKKIQGTIQNNNLRDVEIFTKKKKIAENAHVVANGYANGWLINPKVLCNSNSFCTLNADGSYDMDMIIEFNPQQLFIATLLLSISSFVFFGGYVLYSFKLKKLISLIVDRIKKITNRE